MGITEANKEILNELVIADFDLISCPSPMACLPPAPAAAPVPATTARRTAAAAGRSHAMGTPVVAGHR